MQRNKANAHICAAPSITWTSPARLPRLQSIALTVVVLLAACGGGGSTTPSIVTSTNPVSGGGRLAPQANAIYLGAYALPSYASPGSTPSGNIAALEVSIGRKFPLSLHYDSMPATFPSADEMTDLQHGRLPIVSLDCNDTDTNIAHGSRDADLIAKAAAIKTFGEPVLLRYKWEFNLPPTANGRAVCADAAHDVSGYFSAPAYVAAYQHIHDLMIAQGATNVVWVWNPSAGGVSGIPYWPGDAYVDWVGIDVYDRGSGGTGIFSEPYALYAPVGNGSHPVIVAETGSVAADQPNFLNAAAPATLSSAFPHIKALVYFDSFGPLGDYSFTPAGIAAFQQFAANPYIGAVP